MRFREILPEAAPPAKSFLRSLVAQDQAARKSYQDYAQRAGGYEKARAEWIRRGAAPDDIFGERARLDSFVARMESLPFDTFDREDFEDFWLLAQHCDFDRMFQKRCLRVLTTHLGAEAGECRYLADRISCGLGGTQRFGTQDICAKDEAPAAHARPAQPLAGGTP